MILFKKKRIEFVAQYKIEKGCTECKITYPDEPWLLEFDHIKDKKYDISTMVRSSHTLEDIKNEIEKCEVLCLICHRRRTATRQKWGQSIKTIP